jgi:hypothetical protein
LKYFVIVDVRIALDKWPEMVQAFLKFQSRSPFGGFICFVLMQWFPPKLQEDDDEGDDEVGCFSHIT